MARIVTDDEIKKYEPMVEKFMRDSVCKNWNESSQHKSKDEVSLGNSGWTMADFRQHLRMQVYIGLTKFNPEYRTKEGKSVKESTFIFGHLNKRIGQLMKKLVKPKKGYGVWCSNLEEVLWEHDSGE